ncbi:MAG: hypothetical protein V3V01_15960, partial [Acidimicrobiales bacterium]
INGSNGCPPGTLYGGWWKVDASGFCQNLNGPGPRYYLDCNAACGNCGCGPSGICPGSCSGTPCGCANGNCNNRKAGCTGFRYGQCQQDVPCLGPIVCRVVTCVAPWELDDTCTRTVRTDNNTRHHNAACLQGDAGDPQGSMTIAHIVPGGVRIAGWVLDTASKRVRLSVGSRTVSVRANKNAADLGEIEPSGPPVRWFVGTVKSPNGPQIVCAAVKDSGSFRSVGCRQIVIPSHLPFGAVESAHAGAGEVRVIGWAIDRDIAGPVKLKIYVDGKRVRRARAGKRRRDIGRLYPGFGNHHGFDLKVPADPGAHEVCVYAVNRKGSKARTLLGFVNITVATGSPFGSLDLVSQVLGGVLVKGWAIDPDVDGPAKVKVLVDGSEVAVLTADVPRRDVGRAQPGYGPKHGYEAIIAVDGGTHEICVRASDVGKGRARTLGCRTIDVSTASPQGSIDGVVVLDGRVQLTGWAIDPDVTGPVRVQLLVDGAVVSEQDAVVARNDVDLAFANHGPNHGFDFDEPIASGRHEVCINALDHRSDPSSGLGCFQVDVP